MERVGGESLTVQVTELVPAGNKKMNATQDERKSFTHIAVEDNCLILVNSTCCGLCGSQTIYQIPLDKVDASQTKIEKLGFGNYEKLEIWAKHGDSERMFLFIGPKVKIILEVLQRNLKNVSL